MSEKDDIAHRLAQMMGSGDPPAKAPPPAETPSRSTPGPSPSPRATPPLATPPLKPMATPQPRAKGEEPARAAAPTGRRVLPNSPAEMQVARQPASATQQVQSVVRSQQFRATVTPSLLTLGVLLLGTVAVARGAGESLVIGTLPGGVLVSAGLGGLILLGVGVVNVWQSHRTLRRAVN